MNARTPFRIRPRVRAIVRRIWRALRRLPSDDIQRWEQRAAQFGERAVFNLGHSEAELDRVTHLQKETLYPLLEKQLLPRDHLILDLGCGPGRFTADLAHLTKGRAVGVDPIQKLLDIAVGGPGAEFRIMPEGRIPLMDAEADVIWICLVLGGLRDTVLRTTIAEVRRVLRPGGLIFLVENTTVAPDSTFWRFRSVREYQRLFEPIPLLHAADYDDLGERISVLTGRSAD